MPAPIVPSNDAPPAPSPVPERLLSLDALRGFDMFWIMGADALGGALRTFGQKLQGLPSSEHPHGFIGLLAEQLEHVEWDGFRFYDLIFPLFVFIAGVSIVFSLGKRLDAGDRSDAFLRVIKRGVLLYLLGIFYYGGFSAMEGRGGALEDIRLLGVLQRIAICYTAASGLFLFLRTRGLVATLVGLLVGYWALMTFVPVPGGGAGEFAEGKNLANWIDKEYLPWRKWDGNHDPEGLLSTLPAIGTCLLGVLTGIFLRNNPLPPARKAMRLILVGGVCVALGFLWGLQFPVIKKLWTSSFVLVAGGYSLILLGVFHQVVDGFRWRTWCAPFVWIGTNAIFIYMASNLVRFDQLANRFTGGDVRNWFDRVLPAGTGGIVTALVSSLLCIALARVLYTRKAFFRL